MRFVQITAGTGDFYCGHCVRDDALVKALAHQGHEALMVPLYLPMVTEEPVIDEGVPLFYGGINVYLQQKLGVFRKTPRWLDALFDSTPLLKMAARKTGMTKARDLGEITLSTLQGEEGKQAKELERLIDWLAQYAKPEVVCLSNALLVGLARRIREALGVPVVCTLQGEDGFLDSLRLRLPPDRVHTVYNGIALDGYPLSRKLPEVPVLGYFARMCRDKGLQTLVEAFIELKKRDRVKDLRLKVAGAMTLSDQPFVDSLRQELASADLSAFATFSPNLTRSEKIAFFQGLSVLSVPAHYGEAFGLYVIEAMAVGVPVVQPNHAAFPELIEATEGGILYDHTRPEGLVNALETLLLDPERIHHLGEKGRNAVNRHFTMDRMAQDVVQVLSHVMDGRKPQVKVV